MNVSSKYIFASLWLVTVFNLPDLSVYLSIPARDLAVIIARQCFLDLIRAQAIIDHSLNIGPSGLNIWMDFDGSLVGPRDVDGILMLVLQFEGYQCDDEDGGNNSQIYGI